MVTVVSEGVFSYCGVKVKIDTDRYIGPESAPVRVRGEQIGHVTTAEYGSQMLALGGVHHLTGGSKKEGNITCQAMLSLCNKDAVEMTIDGGATLTVQAGKPPVIDTNQEERMRVGCGSATIGMFALQWHGHADEVIVVDDHITGVLSEHQSVPRHAASRDPRARPPVDPLVAIFRSPSRARGLGRHRHHRTAVDHRKH